MCQLVAYRRIKTTDKFKMSARKWPLTRGGRLQELSNYSDFTEKILIFGKVVYIFARFMTMREK